MLLKVALHIVNLVLLKPGCVHMVPVARFIFTEDAFAIACNFCEVPTAVQYRIMSYLKPASPGDELSREVLLSTEIERPGIMALLPIG